MYEMFSRRAITIGLGTAALASATRAQIATWGEAPPALHTSRSQFVELRPLQEVPSLVLQRIDGKTIALNAYRGKAVLVNFWATWCPPCRRELPLLDKLRQTSSRRSLEIVPISIDKTERSVVEGFLKRLNVTHLRPFVDADGRIAKQAGSDAPTPFVLWGMPISYIIDRDGRLAGYITGEVDWTSNQGRAFLNYYAGG
ncbi:MAG: TlpA family protein disulfide reductase [Pseudolabrys sp.]|nr:TlpA family protein disulfide reductase [Pseudolabrys sp.]